MLRDSIGYQKFRGIPGGDSQGVSREGCPRGAGLGGHGAKNPTIQKKSQAKRKQAKAEFMINIYYKIKSTFFLFN